MNKKQKSLILLALVLFTLISCQDGHATTYYISNQGSDKSNGKSKEAAWQTISKVNSKTFLPGDSILFKRGDVWRETLIMAYSGVVGDPIFFGDFGSGEKPCIFGSTQILSWTNVTGNIWAADQPVLRNPLSIDYGAQIFFNSNSDSIAEWGRYKPYEASFENMIKEYNWTWNANTIYIFSPSNPNARYVDVEAPQRERGVMLRGNAYLSFKNFDIRYLVSAGIYESYGNVGVKGLSVTYCDISNIGTKGGSKAFGLSVTSSNAYYAHNVIHDCGRRNISINLYATTPVGTMQDIIIENNYLYHGWHTTGVDCINSGDHTIDNLVIRNNIIQGDVSVILGAEPNDNSNGLYISNQTSSTGIISNVYIYNNIITYSHGKGIALGNIDKAYIMHNTLYGFNPTLANGQALISIGERGNRDVVVKNNILYNDADNSFNHGLNSLLVTKPDISSVLLDYNLYFNSDAKQHVLEFYQAGSFDDEYYMSSWLSYLRDKTPNDANSPTPTDPLFVDAPRNLSLQMSSVAVGAGITIDWIKTDFYGNAMNNPPDIGAIQFGSGPPAIEKENKKLGLIFAPNPASNNVKVSFEGEMPSNTFFVRMFNTNGGLILKTENFIDVKNCSISLDSNYNSGVYLVEAIFDNSVAATGKLVIIK